MKILKILISPYRIYHSMVPLSIKSNISVLEIIVNEYVLSPAQSKKSIKTLF